MGLVECFWLKNFEASTSGLQVVENFTSPFRQYSWVAISFFKKVLKVFQGRRGVQERAKISPLWLLEAPSWCHWESRLMQSRDELQLKTRFLMFVWPNLVSESILETLNLLSGGPPAFHLPAKHNQVFALSGNEEDFIEPEECRRIKVSNHWIEIVLKLNFQNLLKLSLSKIQVLWRRSTKRHALIWNNQDYRSELVRLVLEREIDTLEEKESSQIG